MTTGGGGVGGTGTVALVAFDADGEGEAGGSTVVGVGTARPVVWGIEVVELR